MHRRVNKYPIQRAFTAIGSGGSEFKASMIKAVEQVTGPVHVECISERPSSKGSYISVTVRVWGKVCSVESTTMEVEGVRHSPLQRLRG